MNDSEFFKAITGIENTELTANDWLDCGNCFTRIPGEVLEDAGDVIYLNEYTCENCNEPLGF